ncbi:hypothetical protein [Nocardia sp. NPDC050406]|uniref:hypothetical protein n=1 Tax=Nocardia sp. NPDC050406 TaxID=3364318 RepID=UPI0037B75E0E
MSTNKARESWKWFQDIAIPSVAALPPRELEDGTLVVSWENIGRFWWAHFYPDGSMMFLAQWWGEEWDEWRDTIDAPSEAARAQVLEICLWEGRENK